MTRTEVEASNGLQAVGTPSTGIASLRASRRLLVLPVALLLAFALAAPTAAIAASPSSESGYAQKPPEPKAGTSPSKTSTTPAAKKEKEVAPAKESSAPASAPAAESSKTLPFTGFDLRWTVGIGLLLMGAGFSIVAVQRRQRRDTRR